MKILLTGASGFIGSSLSAHLQSKGHTLGYLSRKSTEDGQPHWDLNTERIDLGRFCDADAVIHLAGEPIASGRWSSAKKDQILTSREVGTRLLSKMLASLPQKPRVLISGSAIGFYGPRGDQHVDEATPSGQGFLAEVCQRWEAATQPAREVGIRVVNARFGIVLSPEGGALAAMLPPFRFGMGGPIGTGSQYMSWISLNDVVRALSFLLEADSVDGPVNLTAPASLMQRDFARTLGRVLKRPTVIPMPAMAAKVLLGSEKAQEMLLNSTRVQPARLLEAGFTFTDPELEPALQRMLQA